MLSHSSDLIAGLADDGNDLEKKNQWICIHDTCA
jgi:hypothetical protein